MSRWGLASRTLASVLVAMAVTAALYRLLGGETWLRASLFAALTVLVLVLVLKVRRDRRGNQTEVRCSVDIHLRNGLPVQAALELAERAVCQLDRIRPSSVTVSVKRHSVAARTRWTRRSWGERVGIVYTVDSEGIAESARLTSVPLLPTTLFDGGENQVNVDALERWYRREAGT